MTFTPVPSEEVADLLANTKTEDIVVNGDELTTVTRTTKVVRTFAGINAAYDSAEAARNIEFQQFLAASGFEYPPLVYVDGVPLQVDRSTQTIERAGNIYSVKVPNTFPFVLTGTFATDAPNLVLRNDQTLRTDLAAPSGLSLSGFQQAGPGMGIRDAQSKVRERVTPLDVAGVFADGIGNDTPAFTALESSYQGRVIDLCGLTYLVTTIPIGNVYVNGFWILSGVTYPSDDNPAGMSATDNTNDDTGGVGSPYSGGTGWVTDIPAGRTTRRTSAVMASQGSRAQRDGAIVISSIYSRAKGNRSGVFAARQSQACSPQSVIIACEEAEHVQGFQGAAIACQFTTLTGSSVAAIGTDECYASGSQLLISASFRSYGGRGGGFRGTPVFLGGVIQSVTIDKPGANYNTNDPMFVSARRAPATTNAVLTYTVDPVTGGVTSVNVVDGGLYNDDDADVRITGAGQYSMLSASARSRIDGGQYNTLVSSDNSTITGSKNLIAASDQSSVTTSAAQSVLLCGLYSQVTQARSLTIGKRVLNALADTTAWGGGSTGTVPLGSNRRAQLGHNSGNLDIGGALTGSVIFTDYAEMFENCVIGIIALGTLVTLVGRKVRPAKAGEEIIGVVSGTALIIAGDSPFQWAGRHLTGEMGEPLYHEIPDPDWEEYVPDPMAANEGGGRTEGKMIANPKPREMISVPQENPDFDPDQENIPRSKRPEAWSCIGLTGQVHVKVGEGVKPGDYIAAGDVPGTGVKSAMKTNMLCMEIRTPFNEDKGYAVGFCLVR